MLRAFRLGSMSALAIGMPDDHGIAGVEQVFA